VGAASTTLICCGPARRRRCWATGCWPLNLGTFLRSFTFGHVRQPDRLAELVLTRAWQPAPDQVLGR
jgi:hypothetical protein